MRLTTFSDYALRLLIMADSAGDNLVTIEAAATRYNISRTHLMKVANQLTRSGYLEAVRGRSGGLRLARPADQIKIGDVIRATEPDFALVECFMSANDCCITGACRLPRILREALDAFLDSLDKYTLADIALRGLPWFEQSGRVGKPRTAAVK
jgi:Rrf2 family transcriptional regulator, nitric oxide-sensitive transcriptional repressor